MKIHFDEPNNAWSEYGFAQYPILINEEKTGYKAITRDGHLVKILGQNYFLFPNEEALKVADRAAELAGLNPLIPLTRGVISRGNRLYNSGETQMRALYVTEKDRDVAGEDVRIGVNVYNSIDGSSSFGCGIFTYRSMCSNGVIYGKQDIYALKRMHTKGMKALVEDLQSKIVIVMDKALGLLDRYQLMAEQKITEKLITKILNSRLSKRVLPGYITTEKAELPDLNEWELYNDITELIWHNVKTGLKTKTFQFNTLHAAIPTLRV